MNKIVIRLIGLFFISQGFASYHFFTPPDQFECINPKHLKKHVEIGFVGKSKKSFKPSINLAKESVSCSIQEYVKAVKEIHAPDPNIRLRTIGKCETKAGTGRLLEMTMNSFFGKIRLLQCILIKDGQAFILTGAVKKEEFAKYYPVFLKAFSSFTQTDDLFSCLNQDQKSRMNNYIQEIKKTKTALSKHYQKKLQDFLLNDCKNLGKYWQILAFKKITEESFLRN